MSLDRFHPVLQRWFTETLGAPTTVQTRGWDAIRDGRHTLIAAPTGSGKTLAAFFNALDDLFVEGLRAPLPDEVRVVYISPLKALSADIHKNLAEPRRGIRRIAEEMGLEAPKITAGVRTGDTTSSERAAMLRKPPHILVTTPESLYLLLTAERSREMLRTARTVIVDEIHAVIGTRRGAHLAITLERLQRVAAAPLLRLGLSATQKPIELVANYLAGLTTPAGCAVAGGDACGPAGEDASVPARIPDSPVTIIDEGHRRTIDLALEIPRSNVETVMSNEVWGEYYDRLTQLIHEHKTTLVFVNTRRMAERVARHLSERLGDDAVTAHHGSLSKDKRLDAESRLKNGQLKALVATASLELGIDIGHVDLVCQIASPHRIATLLQRVGRSGHSVSGLPKGRLFPTSLDDLIECAALMREVRRGELDRIVTHDAPLDVLAQQIVAETSCDDYSEDDLFALVRRAWPYRDLTRKDFDEVLAMVSEGFATKRGRRGALVHRDEVNHRVRGRRGSRMLAITSGGAIPEVADYKVVLEPDDTVVGTLNEDFAIESTAGDIFQLGNASWQITQVLSGTVRVSDAKGAPPTIPFWLGEAPARSDELSRAVSEMRGDLATILSRGGAGESDREAAEAWLIAETGMPLDAAREIVAYLDDSRRALGALPTQDTLILERFFDESGGMQLVLHAPFGSRINKAWGLALRKRFCRQFNFELQAAATEDAILLSLGPQHSFPLADVFRYLHPATARDVLVQAMLAAPVFPTRWRWNTTISLAIPRNRGGRKTPPPLQRAMADDLMAAVFPDAAACPENLGGDRELPDHPLVNQVVRDCLEEAMDFDGLARVLTRIHAGEIECIARDTTEPSPLAHEILNAKPYAFLDDAPLEERRTQAVMTRRTTANDLGALDSAAIARVREEARPDPRDADELHDALLTFGFLLEGEVDAPELFTELAAARRATVLFAGEHRQECLCHTTSHFKHCLLLTTKANVTQTLLSVHPPAGDVAQTLLPVHPSAGIWIAAERIPEILAIHPSITSDIEPPASRKNKEWTREDAIVEIIRGRISLLGPTTAIELAESMSIEEKDADAALLKLESEGLVLRGNFTLPSSPHALQWCDRRLLARIHRYTLNRLRAEIEPVTAVDFTRFLFAWQHVTASTRLTGIDGLHEVVKQLDGFEIAMNAWERHVLPLRVDRYDPSLLDALCFGGEIGWARLTTGVALSPRTHLPAWLAPEPPAPVLSERAQQTLNTLRTRGASFARDLGDDPEANQEGITELVAAGLITSDGFIGRRSERAGRWSLLVASVDREVSVEIQARALLQRYGVIFRRLLTREPNSAPWRELARVYRRLEARGEIRGGRFVAGMSGEQFALPDAVERLREIRRSAPDGRLIVISAADPLNLIGILTTGERIRAIPGTRIAYRDGIAMSVMEGDFLRPLAEPDMDVAMALAGRRVPVAAGFVGRA
ncbi:MAG: ATP-dependent helicase Lhr and Lhr-like helicase [Thermoanaerobaculia bacterium]|jgi:ATP-dependent Lhr-like helicase|nr:ATP-dependent helicase Lhr and Lhr-like helicase [Thermoanaerobaculia bacterium]